MRRVIAQRIKAKKTKLKRKVGFSLFVRNNIINKMKKNENGDSNFSEKNSRRRRQKVKVDFDGSGNGNGSVEP